ncbi:MAG: hypothetical protein UX10_C0038G0009 [Candidatus Magasanikbacteria bacterium GW2011_GWA2_45_39]|uniref:Uncharacterized protein n=1 Tax=Candidatus Magasanikbacteria bacterium GW2011_GWA2_45_39 TaxID=1619041 RepID=A0A0G1QBZ2_9BACT|nr:MAG: hypothetical protein UX10_C0038G0009 [Candidatus Magasanikbacteria bacterium GW2011_GWA2_45_39]
MDFSVSSIYLHLPFHLSSSPSVAAGIHGQTQRTNFHYLLRRIFRRPLLPFLGKSRRPNPLAYRLSHLAVDHRGSSRNCLHF